MANEQAIAFIHRSFLWYVLKNKTVRAEKTGIYIAAFTGMKETTFYMLLNIRTAEGFESFGKFNLGNNRDAAAAIFSQLKGSPHADEKTILTMDFVETINELPVNIQILGCTLEEVACNCKIITKETFKLLNLEQR